LANAAGYAPGAIGAGASPWLVLLQRRQAVDFLIDHVTLLRGEQAALLRQIRASRTERSWNGAFDLTPIEATSIF